MQLWTSNNWQNGLQGVGNKNGVLLSDCIWNPGHFLSYLNLFLYYNEWGLRFTDLTFRHRTVVAFWSFLFFFFWSFPLNASPWQWQCLPEACLQGFSHANVFSMPPELIVLVHWHSLPFKCLQLSWSVPGNPAGWNLKQKLPRRGLPCGPRVKAVLSMLGGPGSIPGQGTRSHMP